MAELLAVIIIMSILMIIIYPSYLGVSTSIKQSNLENKENIISTNMLNYANKYLMDDIKYETCHENNCCMLYDLEYIIELGIYSTEDSAGNIIFNPVTGKELKGCVEVRYNTEKLKLESRFIRECIPEEIENCGEIG